MTNEYQDTLIIKAGTAKVIEIPFCGAPQPQVTWKVNGGPIKDDRFQVETIRNMTCLRMKAVKKSDSADYTIALENECGAVNMTIKVIVIGE